MRWFKGRPWTPGTDISPKQTEFATDLRIPLLTSAYPDWSYVTGIVVGDDALFQGAVPTEAEVTVVAQFLEEYQGRWFGPSSSAFRTEQQAFAPYDIDSGANSTYFMKHDHSGWSYRKYSWVGPEWVPGFREPPLTIEQVIERMHEHY